MNKTKIKRMKNLQWFELIGQIIPAIIGILALTGNSFNETPKWYKKLNWRGYLIAIMVVTSVVISLKETSIVNDQNDSKQFVEKSRYDSLKVKFDTIACRLSRSSSNSDTLKKTISRLRADLYDLQNNEFKEQRKTYEKNKRIMFENLYSEVVENIETLEKWDAIKKIDLFDTEIPASQLKDVYLKNALTFSITEEIRNGIHLIITDIDVVNRGIEAIKLSSPKSISRETNVKTLFSFTDTLKYNLEYLRKKIKQTIPDYKIEYTSSKGKVTW